MQLLFLSTSLQVINKLTTFHIQEGVQAWIKFQKKKWEFQQQQRSSQAKRSRKDGMNLGGGVGMGNAGKVVRSGPASTIGGFLRRAQRTLMDVPWQIIQAGVVALDDMMFNL